MHNSSHWSVGFLDYVKLYSKISHSLGFVVSRHLAATMWIKTTRENNIYCYHHTNSVVKLTRICHFRHMAET